MQANRKSIKEWAEDERPREKLLLKGTESLSNSELIAILIGSGTQHHSALEVAQSLLSRCKNNLSDLGKLNVSDLMDIKGIGPARAVTIAAALELGRRRQAGDLQKPIIKSSSDIAGFLQAHLKDQTREVFAVVYLNRSNKIIHWETISEGGITGTVADPRIIFKKALIYNAVHLILCHNHPSGNLNPSQADKLLTQKIKEGAKLFDIQLLDHIIVSDEGFLSFADEGLL